MSLPKKGIEKVFMTGLTSLRLNALELENLGNYVIIEPMFRSFRRKFPNVKLTTTLQLSDDFIEEHKITVMKGQKYWTYNMRNMAITFFELICSMLYRLFRKLGMGPDRFLATERLKEISQADAVIDFSGDMYGDNALNRYQFITAGILVPYICNNLGKKMYSIASSPGPFSTPFKYKWAKRVLSKFDFVAAREPISQMLLNGIGLTGDRMKVAPCFSFGFSPKQTLNWDEVLQTEKWLSNCDKPVVGLILSNLNMISGKANQWPRPDEDFKPFLKLIEYLVKDLSVRVCIFSHRHKVDADGRLSEGLDQKIVNRIVELIPAEWKGCIHTLGDLYDASTLNRIIGHFDMLISGRIHGAVQGISQSIPTVIIDYGLEPKAHKLKGLALLAGLHEYVCDPHDDQAMIQASYRMWNQRASISAFLQTRVPQLVEESESVWDWIKQDVENNTNGVIL